MMLSHIKIKHTDGQYTIYHNGKAWVEMFDSLELAIKFVESYGYKEFEIEMTPWVEIPR